MNSQQNGRMNVFRTLAGGYLLYLGCNLLYTFWKEGGTSVWIVIPASVLFIAVGGVLLWREWKAYKYAAAHKDDPATWNDELAEEAARAAESGCLEEAAPETAEAEAAPETDGEDAL